MTYNITTTIVCTKWIIEELPLLTILTESYPYAFSYVVGAVWLVVLVDTAFNARSHVELHEVTFIHSDCKGVLGIHVLNHQILIFTTTNTLFTHIPFKRSLIQTKIS